MAGACESARRLFAWHADDVWLCPSAEVTRFSTHELADDASPADRSTDPEEPRAREWS